MRGESIDVPRNDVAEFKGNFPSLSSGFDAKDIFNADETALYYNALPDRTLSWKSIPVSGTKKMKDRVTLLLGGSMLGEKLNPLVIGRYHSPRCLKGLDRTSLPCSYKDSRNAWMNSNIFRQWLSELNEKMARQRRKILLLVDNAACHRNAGELSNIEIVFLPPNCTSILQPMDQGVIWSFKCHFRRKLLEFVISSVENGAEISKQKISILEAMHFAKRAWAEVHPDVIKNAFRKADLAPRGEGDLCLSPEITCDLIPNFSQYVKIDENLFQEEYNGVDVDDDEVRSNFSVIES